MRILSLTLLFGALLLPFAKADVTYVSSQQDFTNAYNGATLNDTIIWEAGTYADIYMNVGKDRLTIMAETPGSVVFTGASRVNLSGDYITLHGFQFLNGNIGTSDVINIRGSYNLITQVNINAYTSYKYLRIREESQFTTVSYCNFENRLNLDDQNILSVLVDKNQPGYHKIQYCSFKNFEGAGNDMGIEPIRIGLSTQADHVSRTLVEYCYFTQCDGDGELISSKATQNVYRFNTFENNSKAELVLRHGSEAIVYGNFFLKGKGGIRVREGQNHYIYNNYFYELDDRAIYLQNEDSDPLDNINIAFNTIVDCSEVILGGDGNDKPTRVTFANNIFTDPDDDLFEEPTGTESWIGNIAFGSLGMSLPVSGMLAVNPLLVKNTEGFWGLAENSPAIDAARTGYASLPVFEGIDGIDTDIAFDLMRQNRPAAISEKDLGCNEYPHSAGIQPIATEANTGPDYNRPNATKLNDKLQIVQNLVRLAPNPVRDQLNVTVSGAYKAVLRLELFNMEGKKIATLFDGDITAGEHIFSEDLSLLPAAFYTIRANSRDSNSGVERMQSIRFYKINN